ncbi:acyltransferase [Marinobacter nauticus]|uniref:acyltransferase n=1 Tax=Marinobacter nauticus TaxID=2743 RepID=UPI001CFD7F97|nr:acyltransferase [Marinobacter nauticus]
MKFFVFLNRVINSLIFRVLVSGTKSNIRVAGFSHVNVRKHQIFVGDDFFSGKDLYVSLSPFTKCRIGDAVMFGPEVMILSGNHLTNYCDGHMRYNDRHDSSAKSIVVENGAWVGARSILLSGSELGEGCIVGANSLVNSRVLPYSIFGGQPARFLKCRFDNISELSQVLASTNSKYTVACIQNEYQKYGLDITWMNAE